MKLRHLRYFMVVAEEMSFTKAAVRLRIEPTPLSRAIRDLEHDVGVDLLARAKGRVRLTAAGQAFRESCRRMLCLYDEARKHAHSVANGSRSRLRIGIADRLAQPNLTQLFAMCREEEPATGIGIVEMTAGDLLTALDHDLIDAGVTVDSDVVSGFIKVPVWSERPVAAIPRHHPLLSLERVSLADVLRYPLVLCHPEQCAGGYKLFVKSLYGSGLPPPIITEYVSGHESMLLLVGAGYGIGFGLETQASTYNYPNIIIRPVTEELATVRTFIVTNKARSCLELQRFIERAKRIGGIATAESAGAEQAELEQETDNGSADGDGGTENSSWG